MHLDHRAARWLVGIIGVACLSASCTPDSNEAFDFSKAPEVTEPQESTTTTTTSRPIVAPDGWSEYVSPGAFSVLVPAGFVERREQFPADESIGQVGIVAQSDGVLYQASRLDGVDADESDITSFVEGLEETIQDNTGEPANRVSEEVKVLSGIPCRTIAWDGVAIEGLPEIAEALAFVCINSSGLLISLVVTGPADMLDRPTTDAFIGSLTLADH